VAPLHGRWWSMGKCLRKYLDNTHLVAMDDTLDYSIRKFGGLKTFFFGGEGFVFTVRGSGRLLLQSRNPAIWYTRRS